MAKYRELIWQEFAACKDKDYFCELPAKEAKKFCAECLVTNECLQYGLNIKGYTGGIIYGGLTAGERKKLKEQVDPVVHV